MAAVLQPTHPAAVPQGGGFLFQEAGRTRITTPETFTEEQRMLFRTALQFAVSRCSRSADAHREERRRASSAPCCARPASSGC